MAVRLGEGKGFRMYLTFPNESQSPLRVFNPKLSY